MRTQHPKFTSFIERFTELVDHHAGDEAPVLEQGRQLLAALVREDDWLPEQYAQAHPQYYQQYALHVDPQERFSVVSFVWGPGQKTPIHNHTVWALIGMLRGGEKAEDFQANGPGEPMTALGSAQLEPGTVESLRPTTGDTHRVSNLLEDRVSISVHVYGGNIGRISRHVFDAQTGTPKPFVSGYSNEAEVSQAS